MHSLKKRPSRSINNSNSSFLKKRNRPFIQPKLRIGKSNDEFEQQADAVANKITKKVTQSSSSLPIDIQKKGIDYQHAENNGGEQAPNGFESKLYNSKGKGSLLSKDIRSEMETSFGSSFKNVRIHTDSEAVQMNNQINAHAFTNGNDIYFNKSQFNPQNSKGKKLLAHELTHTIQQKGNTLIQRSEIEDCSKSRKKEVQDRHNSARKLLKKAITITNKAQKNAKAKKAMKTWFKINLDKPVSLRNLKNLVKVEKALKSTYTGSKDVSYECDTHGKLELCKDGRNAIALWSVHICPSWFNKTKDRQEMILIHEWTHKYGIGVSRVFETYCWEDSWEDLTPEERVTMPDAYEGYVSELTQGKGTC